MVRIGDKFRHTFIKPKKTVELEVIGVTQYGKVIIRGESMRGDSEFQVLPATVRSWLDNNERIKLGSGETVA